MPLTPDDFISMHKTTEQIIESMQLIETSQQTGVSIAHVNSRFESIRQSVLSLAVIQRDLIKSVLEGPHG